MHIPTELYAEQSRRWPAEGRHILAHHDADSIVVYQAYRPSIAQHAVNHGAFGGDFSYARMSWIKPNFLWMMYRSGWGLKPDQEMTLGLRLSRTFFDSLLAQAVASSFAGAGYADKAEWEEAVAGSQVRLQWDPDHGPKGEPLQRRAIQLGLRGDTLRAFGGPELLEVIDLTEFVGEQRDRLASEGVGLLRTPVEHVYQPEDEAVARRLGLDSS
jgi:hypothetical protein